VKNCSPWEGLTLEKFVEDCLLWEGSHAGTREEYEEQGASETMCDELTATPIPHPPAALRWGGGKEFGSEVEPGKKGGVGRRCFKIWFYFS